MKKILYFILVFSIILITGFIFYNSCQDYVTSLNKSEVVADIIRPSQIKNVKRANYIIRKSAHIVEFATLGMFVMLLTLTLKYNNKRTFFGFAFFYMLSVAVTDEYIQSFSNRTSRIEDVIIDFVGAILGFMFATIIFWLFTKFKKIKSSGLQ